MKLNLSISDWIKRHHLSFNDSSFRAQKNWAWRHIHNVCLGKCIYYTQTKREEGRVFSDACFWWFISLNLPLRYKDDECCFLSCPFPPQNLAVFCKIALHLRASRGCIILDDVRSWKSVLVCNLSQWVETTFSSNQFSLCTELTGFGVSFSKCCFIPWENRF